MSAAAARLPDSRDFAALLSRLVQLEISAKPRALPANFVLNVARERAIVAPEPHAFATYLTEAVYTVLGARRAPGESRNRNRLGHVAASLIARMPDVCARFAPDAGIVVSKAVQPGAVLWAVADVIYHDLIAYVFAPSLERLAIKEERTIVHDMRWALAHFSQLYTQFTQGNDTLPSCGRPSVMELLPNFYDDHRPAWFWPHVAAVKTKAAIRSVRQYDNLALGREMRRGEGDNEQQSVAPPLAAAATPAEAPPTVSIAPASSEEEFLRGDTDQFGAIERYLAALASMQQLDASIAANRAVMEASTNTLAEYHDALARAKELDVEYAQLQQRLAVVSAERERVHAARDRLKAEAEAAEVSLKRASSAVDECSARRARKARRLSGMEPSTDVMARFAGLAQQYQHVVAQCASVVSPMGTPSASGAPRAHTAATGANE